MSFQQGERKIKKMSGKKRFKYPQQSNSFFWLLRLFNTPFNRSQRHLVPWNGVTLIGGVTLIYRVPLSNVLQYRSRSVLSWQVRLWKLKTDVRACVFMLLKPCLHLSNLKTGCKFSISRKNWTFLKTVLTYWMVPYW